MPGRVSNTRSVALLVVSILAIVAVALRFWARKIQKVRPKLSDYLILLGLTFALAENIMCLCAIPSALALETDWGIKDIGLRPRNARDYPEAFELVSKLYFSSQILWAIAVTLIRSSIIFLYIHIFPVRSFRYTCYAVLIFNGVFLAMAVVDECLLCVPIASRWDSTMKCNQSLHQRFLDLLNAGSNMFFDIMVVLLPTPILWSLQMATSKKVALTVMFGLGIFICGITAFRLGRTATLKTPNKDYVNQMTLIVAFLKCLETSFGVFTASLPVLKPVFNKLRDSVANFSGKNGMYTVVKSSSITNFMRVSQLWELISGEHAHRDGSKPTVSMGDWRRNQTGTWSRSNAERLPEMKFPEIHVQRDFHVESASGEDQLGVGKV